MFVVKRTSSFTQTMVWRWRNWTELRIRTEQTAGRLHRKEHCNAQADCKRFCTLFLQALEQCTFRQTEQKKEVEDKIWIQASTSRNFYQRTTFKSFQIVKQDLVSRNFQKFLWFGPRQLPWVPLFLDLCKLSLLIFFTKQFHPRYPSTRLKVTYKDTDYLLDEIKNPDFYRHGHFQALVGSLRIFKRPLSVQPK